MADQRQQLLATVTAAAGSQASAAGLPTTGQRTSALRQTLGQSSDATYKHGRFIPVINPSMKSKLAQFLGMAENLVRTNNFA